MCRDTALVRPTDPNSRLAKVASVNSKVGQPGEGSGSREKGEEKSGVTAQTNSSDELQPTMERNVLAS